LKVKLWIGILPAIVVGVLAYLFLSGYFTQPSGGISPNGQVKEFEISAKTWEFSLKTIEVNAGDTVVLKITGLDDGAGSGHGFALSEFGINKLVTKDQTTTVRFVADKTGTFTFRCVVYCGTGHYGMTGTLIVK